MNKYRGRLQKPLIFHNYNGKYYCFMNHVFSITINKDTKQQLSLLLKNQSLSITFLVTLVYAKCHKNKTLDLWYSIFSLSNGISYPCIRGRSFTAILNVSDKNGGLLVTTPKIEDFKDCVDSCNLTQIYHKGSPFTWLNESTGDDCILRRWIDYFIMLNFRMCLLS